jgi:hypothetical protein
MKHIFLGFSGKKILSAAFISASVLLTSVSSHAAISSSNIELLSGDNSSIQFAGSTSDALLFKMHVNNEKADKFTVTVKNSDGIVLFSKSFNDVDFEKQFKVLKSDQDNGHYYFIVTSSNKNLEETFAVNSTTRLVDDVTVNKL